MQGFPIVGEGCGGHFFKNLPIKTVVPAMGCTPHLKMKPSPSEKERPSLKREAPFHETIPRKNNK